MQKHFMNPEQLEQPNMEELPKEEHINVEGRKERLEGIGFLAKTVQALQCMNDRQFAETIMAEEVEIKEVHYLADNEISAELLFKLYYVATVLYENPHLDGFGRNQAENLKKACQKEIEKR